MKKSSESIVIVLPLPPRILSPNCPVASFRGRMMRYAATKKQKETARAATEEAANGMRWNRASYSAVFYHRTVRRRDDVNHLAMLKAAIDGVILAGLLPDDDREHLHTTGAEFKVDRNCPRVELTFTREE